MYVVTCCVSFCCLALYTTGTRRELTVEIRKAKAHRKQSYYYPAVTCMECCHHSHSLLSMRKKNSQIIKYARLKAYNLTWNCDFLQTDIRQILVRAPTYQQYQISVWN